MKTGKNTPAANDRRTPHGKGRCTLVGAGPGDPELLTIKALKAIQAATVIFVDDLVSPEIVALASPAARIVRVGKRGGCKSTPQAFIEKLMVMAVREGENVVRLKGGDPFVLGRGGEEVAACTAAGVPVHVVPGVTSALAGPAMAGIPLTHRGIAADFAVVSAHLDPTHTGSTFDWAALASGPATLVLLMAMERLESVCQTLIGHGRSADTPAAVVQEATTPAQRTLTSTLGSLADDVRQAGMGSPAVVVVGEVVRLARTVG
jgi:uroporphyrin-III C-methyltransferase